MLKHHFWQHTWVAWQLDGQPFRMVESCACGQSRDHDQMCDMIRLPEGVKRPMFNGEVVIGYA
jgi:hypothetical protein